MSFIKKSANALIEKHNTRDPYKLAYGENIFLVFSDLPASIYANYLNTKDGKFIFINKALDSKFNIHTNLLHEIAHDNLHPNLNFIFLKKHTLFPLEKYERHCDLFVAEILYSDDFMERLNHKYNDEYECYTYEQIAYLEGVDVKFLKLKHMMYSKS